MGTAADWGALAFGVVVGWITYRTLARRAGAAQLSDIATVVGALGGAAITAHFGTDHLFGLYAIGLFAGFFGWLALYALLAGRKGAVVVMGEDALDQTTGGRRF